MTMDRQLPNRRRPSRHRRHEPPLISVTVTSHLRDRKDQAGRRAGGEQIALGIGEATFCRADARTTRQDSTLDPQLAGVLRDRHVERDLDLEDRVAFAGLEGGVDRASYGGVERV